MKDASKKFVCPYCRAIISNHDGEIRLFMDNPSAQEVGIIHVNLNIEIGTYTIKLSQEVREWTPGDRLIISCPDCRKNLQYGNDESRTFLHICYENSEPDLQVVLSTIIGERYLALRDTQGKMLQETE